MTQSITLQAIPSQEIIITLDSRRYEIQIKDAGDFMVYGISRDGETILETGFRIVNGEPLLPYKYMEDGNFAFVIPDSEVADYTNFELTQFLIYASQEELEALR